ncbi:hypothetical protein O181_060890 [Austropuccinia psidii MF-1]|uniref:Uncharacterized protein n=1 Tax=Austropuccinia psidii MF-1 TaxID=1389203 RepID=A0A9Q3EE55_9BASI|nr:hypothetical protein [Austropuccinia psidii MF-1]
MLTRPQHTQEVPPIPPPPILMLPHPPLLTVLMLLQHPQDMCPMPPSPNCLILSAADHPYTLHPQDETTMPPPMSAFTPTTYNPYAPTAPSRYASNTTLDPPYA